MKMRVQTLPTEYQCRACMSMAEIYNETPKCSECNYKNLAKLIHIERGYGYVIVDGETKITRLDLDYIKLLEEI